MNSAENRKTDNQVLLTQYEQAWQEVQHQDSLYTQTALLYMALVGVYIGSIDKFAKSPFLISTALALIGVSIVGAMWRIRKLIDQQLSIVTKIEEITSMKLSPKIHGIGTIRTSTYLIVVVITITALAIYLTLTH